MYFYLPRKDNDGRPLRREIRDAENEFFCRFGGLTMRGTIKGVFRMPDGSLSRDVLNAYELVTESERVAEAQNILMDFKAKTTQAAMYFEVQRDTDVKFL